MTNFERNTKRIRRINLLLNFIIATSTINTTSGRRHFHENVGPMSRKVAAQRQIMNISATGPKGVKKGMALKNDKGALFNKGEIVTKLGINKKQEKGNMAAKQEVSVNPAKVDKANKVEVKGKPMGKDKVAPKGPKRPKGGLLTKGVPASKGILITGKVSKQGVSAKQGKSIQAAGNFVQPKKAIKQKTLKGMARKKMNEPTNASINSGGLSLPKGNGVRSQGHPNQETTPNPNLSATSQVYNISFIERAETDQLMRRTKANSSDVVNIGDELVWNNPIYDDMNNTIGRSEGSCTRVPRDSWQCLFVIDVSNLSDTEKGQIYAEGSLPDFGGSAKIAIIGGTGSFTSAVGTMYMQYPKNASNPPLKFTYELKLV